MHDREISESSCMLGEENEDCSLLDYQNFEELKNFNLFSLSAFSVDELIKEIKFETPCGYSSTDSSISDNNNKNSAPVKSVPNDCMWATATDGWLKERLEIDINHDHDADNNNKTSFPSLNFVSPSSVFPATHATSYLSRQVSFDSATSDNSLDDSNDVIDAWLSSVTASERSSQLPTMSYYWTEHLFPPSSDKGESGGEESSNTD